MRPHTNRELADRSVGVYECLDANWVTVWQVSIFGVHTGDFHRKEKAQGAADEIRRQLLFLLDEVRPDEALVRK